MGLKDPAARKAYNAEYRARNRARLREKNRAEWARRREEAGLQSREERRAALAKAKAERIAAGECPKHRGEMRLPGRKCCARCLESARKLQRSRAESAPAGKCPQHPDRPVAEGRARCAECVSYSREYARKLRKARGDAGVCVRHPDRPAAPGKGQCEECLVASAEANLVRKYGVTLEWFRKTLERQDFACAICGDEIDGRSAEVDHNHATGRVRELLCGACNPGIGLFREDPRRLRAAIAYLEKHHEIDAVLTAAPTAAAA